MFTQIKESLGDTYRLRLRMDGDFYKKDVLNSLENHYTSFAIEVSIWRRLDLQRQIRQRGRLGRITAGMYGFSSSLTVKNWKRTFRIGFLKSA